MDQNRQFTVCFGLAGQRSLLLDVSNFLSCGSPEESQLPALCNEGHRGCSVSVLSICVSSCFSDTEACLASIFFYFALLLLVSAFFSCGEVFCFLDPTFSCVFLFFIQCILTKNILESLPNFSLNLHSGNFTKVVDSEICQFGHPLVICVLHTKK